MNKNIDKAVTRQDFIKAYAVNMKEHCESGKAAYVIPTDGWEGLATRMVEGILNGRAHISDMAKKTAKQFGAKPTCAGVTGLVKSFSDNIL